jgi:photosystem II stability/assembly factor-like uncharacterized protein
MRRVALLVLLAASAHADGLHVRPIGPFRGGRTKAAVGIPGRPGSFLIGVCNGGVWRTGDYGRTWQPIFDDQPTGSIGAIAIAPSRPDTIYVGSGEGLQRPDLSTGDGIYKSTDGGRSWTHLGLRDGQQIPQIAVDPRDPDRLYVAVLGHPFGPSQERGIFRSTDGGASFDRVLHVDPDTGGVDVVVDPTNPDTVYAALWESRQAPWEDGVFTGPGSGLYKSTDGGTTWRRLEAGLPGADAGLGRIGLGIAPSRPERLFATVEAKKGAGLYRSDDGGATWARTPADPRVVDHGSDFAEVKVDPRDADTVYTASVVLWKSTDGGASFTPLRGSPGGDDYHRIWIDPERPTTLLVAGDQGAIVTVDGGTTWSSWYNQPTAQMYHVATDAAWPYRVCGGQQESGSACIASRGGDGAIGVRDWHPVGIDEYAYAAPDPRDPDVVYGGRITRYDRRTGQAADVSPHPWPGGGYRTLRTQPVVFAPTDPRTLYFAANTLWRTRDGGRSWTEISPDLTRASWAVPPSVGKYAAEVKVTRRGVIYAVAPSYVDGATIWAGTDDGLIHVTRDGGRSWTDVTPPGLAPWAKVSIIDAGRFDAATAYAAINTLRLDDLRPHIYRTHDGGRSWTEIVAGLPDGAPVNVVREDPRRRGLLYAGTELALSYSPDDGASWRPLRLDAPATSIRDLVVKDDDLVVATHGRGFWIIDDIEPLRQLDRVAAPALLAPAPAWRARWNTNSDTPQPPDEPTAPNPPDGAILDYLLGADARAVTLEIFDGDRSVRRFSSDDPAEPVRDEGNVPRQWLRPPPRLPATAGLHRLVWDLHGPPPAALRFDASMAAVPGDTPREPRGPWVVPGRYRVVLTVDGQERSQTLTVRMDPRVTTPLAGLRAQLALSERLVAGLAKDRAALAELRALEAGAAPELAARLRELGGGEVPWWSRERPAPTLAAWNGRAARLYERLQQADVAPTPTQARAVDAALKELGELLGRWDALRAAARN